jgi:hypothetical protein
LCCSGLAVGVVVVVTIFVDILSRSDSEDSHILGYWRRGLYKTSS